LFGPFEGRERVFPTRSENPEAPSVPGAESASLSITLADGTRVALSEEQPADDLRAGILAGTYRRDMKVTRRFKTADDQWQSCDSTVQEIARDWFATDVLCRPIGAHAAAGLNDPGKLPP
jgi:hypothetical protein